MTAETRLKINFLIIMINSAGIAVTWDILGTIKSFFNKSNGYYLFH